MNSVGQVFRMILLRDYLGTVIGTSHDAVDQSQIVRSHASNISAGNSISRADIMDHRCHTALLLNCKFQP
jgi:hypothetical protein